MIDALIKMAGRKGLKDVVPYDDDGGDTTQAIEEWIVGLAICEASLRRGAGWMHYIIYGVEYESSLTMEAVAKIWNCLHLWDIRTSFIDV